MSRPKLIAKKAIPPATIITINEVLLNPGGQTRAIWHLSAKRKSSSSKNMDDLCNQRLISKASIHAKLGNPISLLALNLLVTGMLVLAFKNLPDYRFLPCTYTFIQPFLLALAGTLGLNVLLALFLRRQARMSLLVLGALLLVSLYFGSYNYSPLRFLNRENPILRGFLVSPQGRVEEVVASGDIITLSMGVPAAISIESDLHDVSCRWSSRNGGAWDDPSSCDTTYIPPAADYDILSVRIMPGCRLAPTRGQLKISILP